MVAVVRQIICRWILGGDLEVHGSLEEMSDLCDFRHKVKDTEDWVHVECLFFPVSPHSRGIMLMYFLGRISSEYISDDPSVVR